VHNRAIATYTDYQGGLTVTVTWSLTTTAPGRIDTTIGAASDAAAAVGAALAAAQTAIDDARLSAGPAARYELRAGAELVAIIQTGADEHGEPDHDEAGDLLARIAAEEALSSTPC
jgi:hypothetical protein